LLVLFTMISDLKKFYSKTKILTGIYCDKAAPTAGESASRRRHD